MEGVESDELPAALLDARAAARRVEALGVPALERLCASETQHFAPAGRVAVDPRLGLPVLYSEARASRPRALAGCPVCNDRLCPAVDIVEAPDGDATWLAPNLFPLVSPTVKANDAAARGMHFVQWTSRRHDVRWPDGTRDVAARVLSQLARVERFLLEHAGDAYPETGPGRRGHVGIVKNVGANVGGSVEHDHQQILLTNIAPLEPRLAHDLGPTLRASQHQHDLHVDTVDGNTHTLVAPFMRRALQSFVLPADPGAHFLHDLSDDDLASFGLAIARVTGATSRLMQRDHGEPAWNVVFHSGTDTPLVAELRAYTQPLGGFEQLGLYLCEETPETSAGRLREALTIR